MFPSGKWTGHWDQAGYGRQDMHNLEIYFEGGTRIRGKGFDVIGGFDLAGEVLDEQKVEIVKTYNERHSVVYLGTHDGEGTISGAWALFGDQGTFALRPLGRFQEIDAPIVEIQF